MLAQNFVMLRTVIRDAPCDPEIWGVPGNCLL